MKLESDVELDSDLTDANAQGGNITFTNDSPVVSAANEFHNLHLDGGTGAIYVNANLGGTTAALAWMFLA